jgi:hypothetical protein
MQIKPLSLFYGIGIPLYSGAKTFLQNVGTVENLGAVLCRYSTGHGKHGIRLTKL